MNPQDKKLEILNAVFKSKDGLTWNELSEMLNELIAELPTIEQFNKISDLRTYFLYHPDSEMVRSSCLHFLGDAAQEWYANKDKHEVVSEWILSKDRLPEGRFINRSKTVLGILGDNIGLVYYDHACRGWYHSGYPNALKIDYWQPLPEPPKI